MKKNREKSMLKNVRNGMKACKTHTLTHEEVKAMKEDLKTAIKQSRELRKLMKSYIKVAKKAGLSSDPKKAIAQIQNFIKLLKECQETKKVCGVT